MGQKILKSTLSKNEGINIFPPNITDKAGYSF